MQLPLREDAISFKDAAHTFLCHALQPNASSYKIVIRFHFSFCYPDSSERWIPGHLLSTFLTPRSHCHSSGDSCQESALSVCWNPAWFFSRQSRLVTLSHLVHSRSPSPAGCSPLQLAKTFIGLLTVFVSPSLLSISVYFILSFRMKAVNLSTAHALNGFLIINLKLFYKRQWREKIPEARCKITERPLKSTPDMFTNNFSLRKGFSSLFLVPFRLMILWFFITENGFFYFCVSAWTVQGDCSAELLNQLLICLAVVPGGCNCTEKPSAAVHGPCS